MVRNFFCGSANSTLVVPGFGKFNIRPSFLCEIQVDLARRDIHKAVMVIQRQIIMCLALKVLQHFGVSYRHPARRGHVDSFELALYFVFILQAMRYDFELQRTDRAKMRSLFRSGLNS